MQQAAGQRSRRANPVRRLLLCLLLAAAANPQLHAQDTESRIAYVDMQRLIDNAPQVIESRARLAREFAAGNAQLEADKQRLAELEARIAQSNPAPAALNAEAAALRRSVERRREKLRSDLSKRSQEETDRAWPLINDVVAEYARLHGYDLVVASPVVYASGRIDITERVLDELRRSDSSGEETP